MKHLRKTINETLGNIIINEAFAKTICEAFEKTINEAFEKTINEAFEKNNK